MSFDPQPLLSGLKPFQRATVDYVMRRFDAGAPRFLVADEVGLGKTRVAQGVVAHILSRLPEGERADIIYVCSNSAIARQNLRLLNVLGEAEVRATRLTLLCDATTRLREKAANFIALTPATSFDKSGGLGLARERALIRKLLQHRIDGELLDDLLRYPVRSDGGWAYQLERVQPSGAVDSAAIADLLLANGIEERIRNTNLDDPDARRPIVQDLLQRLARQALSSLRPKLVIFDEFQRFRSLFTEGDSEAQALMRTFLQAESAGARVLFLSATPYRMLTLNGDDPTAGDHHADFLETISVLYGEEGPAAAEALRQEMRCFRDHLRDFAQGHTPQAAEARSAVETRLRKVMSRNERVAGDSGDAGIRRRILPVPVEAEDLRQAKAVHQVAKAIRGHGAVEYWKSAPYLFSFMGDYDLAKKIREYPKRAALASTGKPAMVSEHKRQRFERIPPGNGRMRALIEETLDQTDLHRRLWLPPSLPYLQGARRLTKTLIFSDWQMVPEAVAALVSYEAERKLRHERGLKGPPKKREAPLLRLRTNPEQLGASMHVMTLLYPSAFLARIVDPLRIWREHGEISPAAMQAEAEKLVAGALADTPLPEAKGQAAWEALARLDVSEPGWVSAIRDGLREGSAREETGAAAVCLDAFIASDPELSEAAASTTTIRFLARVALGSPATCLLRALDRHADLPAPQRAFMAAQVAMGFLTLFNHREVRPLLLSEGSDGAWSRVLDYCAEHDLQAVLDEYVFQITGGKLVEAREEGEPAHHGVARRMREAIGLRTAPITLHDPFRDEGRSRRSMPSHLAARFAANATRDQDGGGVRIDTLRDAFNSPFRPFVLASTSVGQEGLDFHLYCHRLWHWNLPGNPVDMEQREGRVQRFLNHAVRLNIATNHAMAARDAEGPAWPAMIAAAEAEMNTRGEARLGLRPHWLYAGDAPDPVEIETVLPLPPLSREAQRATWLLRTTALYRLAFGQPRQSDLLAMLETAEFDEVAREQLLIRLAPPVAA
ncbi:DEAD/DEAH box helicase [Paracoccus litorisediminis]|uniref:DEAD/DEAH box helicase n=1 Tax=Paracoccus litorisediminis TaxID=2006130 RepID=A0A844HQW8_9RHOB|nr:DEAD/DEAH box helicase [Paracoccus litorisediminis]MTH59992.1 DEAD/DEAH box helicase [Paracoccus litorisediminis]